MATESALPTTIATGSSTSSDSILNGWGWWSSPPSSSTNPEEHAGGSVPHKTSPKSLDGTSNESEDEEMGQEYQYEDGKTTATRRGSQNAAANGAVRNAAKTGVMARLWRKRSEKGRALKVTHRRRNSDPDLSTASRSTPASPSRARRFLRGVNVLINPNDDDDDKNNILGEDEDDLDDEEKAKLAKKIAKLQRIKSLDALTDQRLKQAMLEDDTGSVCSEDGVPFVPPPPELTNSSSTKSWVPFGRRQGSSASRKPRDLTKIQPSFIPAPKDPQQLQAARKGLDELVRQAMGPLPVPLPAPRHTKNETSSFASASRSLETDTQTQQQDDTSPQESTWSPPSLLMSWFSWSTPSPTDAIAAQVAADDNSQRVHPTTKQQQQASRRAEADDEDDDGEYEDDDDDESDDDEDDGESLELNENDVELHAPTSTSPGAKISMFHGKKN